MLAESASSPLPALTSSPAPSVHSLPANEDPCSDLQAVSSDIEDGSDECFSHDPTYQPQTQVAFTPTLTPLKNKPFAHRSISASSASNLIQSGHKPNVCILTRETKDMGSTITRPHMIPQATKPKDLRLFEWLLGYDAETFNLDSHFNITFMSQNWHTMFDAGKWAMVPEEPVRKEILSRLAEIKNKEKTKGSSGRVSAWPHFTKVFRKPDGIYRFRFVNISLRMPVTVFSDDEVELSRPQVVDINSDHEHLTMQSHIHPLHVIINAYLKFQDWSPLPSDPPTLSIINDIREIWDVWNSIPPTEEYTSYGRRDHADHSSLAPRSEIRRRSRSRKRSDRDDTSSSRDSRASKRERRSHGAEDGDVQENRQPTGATPSLELSSSNESCGNSSDFNYMGSIQTWRDTLSHGETPSPPDMGFGDYEAVDLGIGSPKVTGYKGWEPGWDRRWVDTSSFSSNDWAYYRRKCDLTGECSSRLCNAS